MVYTTLENALANRKWKPTERMCSVATIVMNGPINTLLKFIFIDSLNHRFSYHSTLTAPLQLTNQLLFQVSTRSFLSLSKTALLSHSSGIQNMSFVPLLFSNKAAIYFSSRFYCCTIAFVIWKTDFIAKMSQVIYFVIMCEATFSKVRLAIFKCTWNYLKLITTKLF